MEFLKDQLSFKILAVLELDWRQNNVSVAPRPFHALSYRIKGDAQFSDGKNSFSAQNGSVLYMPKNVGYRLKTGAEHIYVVHFEMEEKKQNSYGIEVLNPKNPAMMEQMFRSLLEAWHNGPQPGVPRAGAQNKNEQGSLLYSMSVLYRLFAVIERETQDDESNEAYRCIESTIKYLRAHFTESDLSVAELCRIAGVSDTYFRKLFFHIYATTPLKYISDMRLALGAELLRSGYYSVEQVAQKCGFADPKYFSCVFKKKYHCSPSMFRTL